jgi:hypothetical protein
MASVVTLFRYGPRNAPGSALTLWALNNSAQQTIVRVAMTLCTNLSKRTCGAALKGFPTCADFSVDAARSCPRSLGSFKLAVTIRLGWALKARALSVRVPHLFEGVRWKFGRAIEQRPFGHLEVVVRW